MVQKLDFRNNSWLPRFALALFFLVVAASYFYSSNNYYHWEKPEVKGIIQSDGTGYYAYLPQAFIYHTKDFYFSDSIAKKTGNERIRQGRHDKYFIGTAICMTPIFLATHIAAKFTHYSPDGYSFPYEIGVAVNGFVFCCLGLLFLYLFLRTYPLQRSSILAGMALLAFATNLKYYTIFEPSLSHVYSFAMITLFLYLVRKYAKSSRKILLFPLLLSLTLIAIIRPTNFLILLVAPFLFQDFKTFKTVFVQLFKKQTFIYFLGAAFLALTPVLLQLLNVHSQLGIWRINGYRGEGFDNLFHPEIFNVLFSFRKGLFIYTPALILCIFGLRALYRKNHFLFWGWTIFFVIFTYVTASWWNWYYGGGLGMRPFVETYGLFIVPFVILIDRVAIGWKIFFWGMIILFSYHNDFQNYQIKHGIYHYSEMNFERYKHVFFRSARRYEWIYFYEHASFSTDTLQKLKTYYFHPSEKMWSLLPANDASWRGIFPELKLKDSTDLTTKYWRFDAEVKLLNHHPISYLKTIHYQNGKAKEVFMTNYLDQVARPFRWTKVHQQGTTHAEMPSDSTFLLIDGGYPMDIEWKNVRFTLYR